MDQPNQLALMLFDTLAPEGKGVIEAPTALGYHRSNAFIRISNLSLAARRLVDVSHFFVATTPGIQSEYRVDYGLFKWLLATTSENRTFLKKLIRQVQAAAIELNEGATREEPWGAVPLMGEAFLIGGEFIFSLSERLQKAIKNPEAAHFLSLRYVFTSFYSKILYDHVQPYLKEGITPWIELDKLRELLECNQNKTYQEFKHFQAKVIKVGLTEIATVTGMTITLLTQSIPGSKRVGQVRFKWEPTEQNTEQKLALILLKNTYETLRTEFGLSQTDFDQITKNRTIFTDERIQQAMDYTRHKVQANQVKKRVGGYFMKALQESYVIGTLDQEIAARASANAQESARVRKQNNQVVQDSETKLSAKQVKESATGWASYNALGLEEQQILAEEFCKLSHASMLAKRLDVPIGELKDHLNDPSISSSFGQFVATKLHTASRKKKGDDTMNLFKGERQEAPNQN